MYSSWRLLPSITPTGAPEKGSENHWKTSISDEKWRKRDNRWRFFSCRFAQWKILYIKRQRALRVWSKTTGKPYSVKTKRFWKDYEAFRKQYKNYMERKIWLVEFSRRRTSTVNRNSLPFRKVRWQLIQLDDVVNGRKWGALNENNWPFFRTNNWSNNSKSKYKFH